MKLPRLRSTGSCLPELDLASPLSKWLPPGIVQAPPGAATQLLSSLKEQMVIEYPCLGMPLPDFILSWLSGTEARDHPRQNCLQATLPGSQFPVRTRSCQRWPHTQRMQGIHPLGQVLLKTSPWDSTRASGPSVGPPLPLLWHVSSLKSVVCPPRSAGCLDCRFVCIFPL